MQECGKFGLLLSACVGSLLLHARKCSITMYRRLAFEATGMEEEEAMRSISDIRRSARTCVACNVFFPIVDTMGKTLFEMHMASHMDEE